MMLHNKMCVFESESEVVVEMSVNNSDRWGGIGPEMPSVNTGIERVPGQQRWPQQLQHVVRQSRASKPR